MIQAFLDFLVRLWDGPTVPAGTYLALGDMATAAVITGAGKLLGSLFGGGDSWKKKLAMAQQALEERKLAQSSREWGQEFQYKQSQDARKNRIEDTEIDYRHRNVNRISPYSRALLQSLLGRLPMGSSLPQG